MELFFAWFDIAIHFTEKFRLVLESKFLGGVAQRSSLKSTSEHCISEHRSLPRSTTALPPHPAERFAADSEGPNSHGRTLAITGTCSFVCEEIYELSVRSTRSPRCSKG